MFDFSNITIDKDKLNKILDHYSTIDDSIETSRVCIGGMFYTFSELFDIDDIEIETTDILEYANIEDSNTYQYSSYTFAA